jgi:8-oxo-dGTP diphosphatase
VVAEEGRLLLARRAGEPEQGKWDLPGGFLEEGEHPLDALRRELREETGLVVEPRDFLGVWMDRYGDGDSAPATLNLYWTAHIVSGEPRPADDVSELRWFPPDDLPPARDFAFHVADVIAAWRARV